MQISRRNLIRSVGAIICVGAVPKFVSSLIPEDLSLSGWTVGIDPGFDFKRETNPNTKILEMDFEPIELSVVSFPMCEDSVFMGFK